MVIDGLVTVVNKQYDLMLLDIMLPEMRGIDILNAYAATGRIKYRTQK